MRHNSLANLGLAFLALQTIALALRILGIVHWPWSWVFLPLWFVLLFAALIVFMVVFVAACLLFRPHKKDLK